MKLRISFNPVLFYLPFSLEIIFLLVFHLLIPSTSILQFSVILPLRLKYLHQCNTLTSCCQCHNPQQVESIHLLTFLHFDIFTKNVHNVIRILPLLLVVVSIVPIIILVILYFITTHIQVPILKSISHDTSILCRIFLIHLLHLIIQIPINFLTNIFKVFWI